MSRRNQLADIDPLGSGSQSDEERGFMTLADADEALFGALDRRDAMRQNVKPVSIFSVLPDVKQPRRAIPLKVRERWSGQSQDIADVFNAWLQFINEERESEKQPPFNLDHYLWSEAVEREARDENDTRAGEDYTPGPMEATFLKVVDLAISIRRDGLANPVTMHRMNRETYVLETGERRWLAYHVLFAYFNGEQGKPNERDKWKEISAIVVDEFSVWRQASENTARQDLNAVGRARQFAILMMDLYTKRGEAFEDYNLLVPPGKSDRPYYAQVVELPVPKGKGEMLLNGLGVSHRAAFTRCRKILSLPDEVWTIADERDISEDELLRLARLEPEEAIQQVHMPPAKVATRNIEDNNKKPKKSPPALFTDKACKRGKPMISKENQQVVQELLRIRDGVGEAKSPTKRKIIESINDVRRWLDELESTVS